MKTNYLETYLYKLHKLTNSLDKEFDQTLRRFGDISLSQLSLLMSVASLQPTSQRRVGGLLGQSPGAISRQVDLAQKQGWLKIEVDEQDRRNRKLMVSRSGRTAIEKGEKALDEHLFQIFHESENQAGLMAHIDQLQHNIEELPMGHQRK